MVHRSTRRSIGKFGTGARLAVGLAFLELGVVGLPPVGGLIPWWQLVLGLVVMPAFAIGLQRVRIALDPRPFDQTGATATALNCAILTVLLLVPVTRWATLVFLGASLLLSAFRGYAGCESLAISNWLLGREDQVGCLFFSPLDALEARAARQAP